MATPEKATEQSSSKTKLADLPARKVEQAKAEQVKGGGQRHPERNLIPCL
jgi:hypothetical protein